MKSKEEILFSHYDKDPDNGLLIDDKSILAAMQEYADEVAVEFLSWYIQGQPSKFEVKRIVKQFMESDYLKQIKAGH